MLFRMSAFFVARSFFSPRLLSNQLLRSWGKRLVHNTGSLNETVLSPSLCGCVGCDDTQQHYLFRESIWLLLCSIDRGPMPASPLEALCLDNPSFSSAVRVYALTTAYHALRRNSAGKVLS